MGWTFIKKRLVCLECENIKKIDFGIMKTCCKECDNKGFLIYGIGKYKNIREVILGILKNKLACLTERRSKKLIRKYIKKKGKNLDDELKKRIVIWKLKN